MMPIYQIHYTYTTHTHTLHIKSRFEYFWEEGPLFSCFSISCLSSVFFKMLILQLLLTVFATPQHIKGVQSFKKCKKSGNLLSFHNPPLSSISEDSHKIFLHKQGLKGTHGHNPTRIFFHFPYPAQIFLNSWLRVVYKYCFQCRIISMTPATLIVMVQWQQNH